MATMLKRRLQESTQESREEALEYVGKMVSLTGRAAKEVRALSHGAAPVDFTKEDLVEVMEELVSEVESAYRVSCTFEPEDGVEAKDPAVARNLYRITQEALSNGIRHGKAEHVKVTLKKSSGRLLLRIKDNGTGIVKRAKGGIGLKNMRRRAEVAPGKSGGTIVTCVVPENGRGT